MQWDPEQVAEAVGGKIIDRGDSEAPMSAVAIDSRQISLDALFVPIAAERDGHDFIPAALAAGAIGYLTAPPRRPPTGLTTRRGGRPAIIEVPDTSAALLDLGRTARRRLAGPIVGITGSVGKTSTKDLAATVLRARFAVTANLQSFNNELGVPLTLLNASEATEVTVVEMGARGSGHIALLCEVARPTVAVITMVAAAHTEQFGDLEAVAQAKGELVEALEPSGLAVLNADDRLVRAMATRSRAATLTYSAFGDRAADVIADNIVMDGELRPRFVLESPWGRSPVRLAARGRHQVGNALAALTVGLHLGVDLLDACQTLEAAEISPWRMEVDHSASGALIVNDTYNANPASMAAALRALAEVPAHRKVAVLGEMAELGPGGDVEHARIAALAGELGIHVVAVGTHRYSLELAEGVDNVAGVDAVAGIDEALEALGDLGSDHAVLVKASRVAGLERLAARLLSA